MTKDEFFTYFREVEPLKDGEKPHFKPDNILTIEDFSTYDDDAWSNLSSIFKNAGLTEKEVNKLSLERSKKRKDLNLLTEEEKRDLNQKEHDEDLVKEIEKIRTTYFCSNLEISDDPNSVLSGLDNDDAEYNVVIIDPAYEAFQGYGQKSYTGSGISLKIYKRFGLFAEKHNINLQPGNSVINIKC